MHALDDVLQGRTAPVVLIPADSADHHQLITALNVGAPIDDDIALVVPTSGTTGSSKGAMLSAAALHASATATLDRLGGPGSWLLALPVHHIAGIQILIRSLLAGTVPVHLNVSSGFDVTQLPAALDRLGPGRRYTSLVAPQLAKILGDSQATMALAQCDAVLLGGGPAPEPVLAGAAAAGIAVVRTYGSSETAGGCIYDGVALDGVHMRIQGYECDVPLESDSDSLAGRIVIGGATVAHGYRNPSGTDAFAEPGWFYTDDIGSIDNSGRLTVLGRIDDAISTGGLTVLPAVVEEVLGRHPAVADCAVFAMEDNRLGQRVTAAIVVSAGMTPPSLSEINAYLTTTLDHTAAPRQLYVLDELPRRGIGKLDRVAVKRWCEHPES